MKINEIENPFREALDLATNHSFTRMIQHCKQSGNEAEVTVLTELEGLPKDEMKLAVQFFDQEGKTTFFHQTPLTEKSAQILGWNLYLLERTTAARRNIGSANTKLMMLDLSKTTP